jgi:hypothetical protein
MCGDSEELKKIFKGEETKHKLDKFKVISGFKKEKILLEPQRKVPRKASRQASLH